MKSPLFKFNFNGGELSPFLDARVDYPKYSSGAKEMSNFIPTVYGPMTKRPGTRFVEDIGNVAYLYPFEFSEDQAYVLAFTRNDSDTTDIHIYTGDGILLDDSNDPVIVTCPYYTIDQVPNLRFAQTGDIIIFVNEEEPPVQVSRISDNEFTVEQFFPLDGPFQDENTDEDSEVQVTTINTTAYEVEFLNGDLDVGIDDGLLRIGYDPATMIDTWFSDSGSYSTGDYLQLDSRIYEITSGSGSTGTLSPLHEYGTESDGNLELTYVSNGYGILDIYFVDELTNIARGRVVAPFPPYIVDDDPTTRWAKGSFGKGNGYPASIVFHQQRLVFGGSTDQPQTIWGSVQGDVGSFAEGTDDDDAYEFTIAANKKNPISWLSSNISLSIGTLGGEFSVTSSGSSITPTDVLIEQIGQYGSTTAASPLIANGFTLFVQSGGRKLRELRYDYDSERNYARDLNKTAEHITPDGINQIVYQSEPYQIIWTIIGDQLFALTYETDEEVYGWSRQPVGTVKSITTIPNGANDRLWLVVERNGSHYIEYLTKFFTRETDLEDAIFTDSSLTYEGEAATVITGLDHLEGETVSILNNGSTTADQVVSGGQVTLQYPTTKCTVGLPMISSWQSMRLEGGSNDGLGQGKSKRISSIVFRLEKTGAGLTYGKGTINKVFSSGYSATLPVRDTTDNMDSPPGLLEGDTYRQPIDGGTDQQFMLRVEHSEPVPCTIIAMILSVDTNQ